jgi:hypothetical protein
MIERPDWTIAYRNPRANRFQRVTDLAVTWVDATAWALAISIVHPELEVWYVTTAERESTYVGDHPCAEDVANILVPSGKRVRVFDTGSLAALGFEHAGESTANAVTVTRPFADKMGTATFRMPHHSVQQVDALFPGMRRTQRVNVTEGTGNTVHIAYMRDDKIAGTACNRELFTINHRRRVFYRSDYPVTCKRCQKGN